MAYRKRTAYNYSPTEWKDRDVITAEKLNKLESAVEALGKKEIVNIKSRTTQSGLFIDTTVFLADGTEIVTTNTVASPLAPTNLTISQAENGDVTINFNAESRCLAYMLYIGKEGLSEENYRNHYSAQQKFVIKKSGLPEYTVGEELTFDVQAFYQAGAGVNNSVKKQSLVDDPFSGSPATRITLTTIA